MGAGLSSNSTDLVTNVMSSISQSTSNAAAQAMVSDNTINIDNCRIQAGGTVNIKQTADTIQRSMQINKSIQNAAVANDIAQKVSQEAASKVGALGLGFAEANNSVYAAVNTSSEIKQALNNATNQYSNIGNTFNCSRSTIISGKDINITQGTTAQNLTHQVLQGSQMAKINNKISQTVKQKATATVEGMAGLLIAIALIIAALGYAIAKPFTTGAFKIIIAVGLVVLIVGIVIFLWLRNTPPFFSPLPRCLQKGSMDSEMACKDNCIKTAMDTISIDSPPLKYTFSTIGNGSPDMGSQVNLARQLISIYKDEMTTNNGGYTDRIRQILSTKLLAITNKLQKLGITTEWLTNSENKEKLIVPNPLGSYMGTGEETPSYFQIPNAFMMGVSTHDGDQMGVCTPGSIDIIQEPSQKGEKCGDKPGHLSLKTCPPDGVVSCVLLKKSSKPPSDPKEKLAWGENVIATYNTADFNAFRAGASIAKDANKEWDILRFVYVNLINNSNTDAAYIANNYGIDDNDLVEDAKGEDSNITTLKQAKNTFAYTFVPTDGINPGASGTTSGGKMTGKFGYCNSKEYKLNINMRKWGGWAGLTVFGFLLIFGFIIYPIISKRKKPGKK